MLDSNNNISTHLLWIIALLLLVISAQVIYAPSGSIIRDYISFASAIASILLALVAIFQSTLSGQSLLSSLSKIQESSTEIKIESENLKSISENFIQIVDNAIGKIDAVPIAVSDLSNRLSEKMESISNNKVNDQKNQNSQIDLYSGSVGAGINLYLLLMAHEHVSDFDPKEVFQKTKSYQSNSMGFFQCVKLFRPHKIQIEMIQNSVFVKDIGDLDKDFIIDIIRNHKNKTIMEHVKIIDEYFKEKDEPKYKEKNDES